ncbi:hypothetical protein ISN45_Aa03g004460, partial [Arabidopsis thaliana x Arabidopsis arenosa]
MGESGCEIGRLVKVGLELITENWIQRIAAEEIK